MHLRCVTSLPLVTLLSTVMSQNVTDTNVTSTNVTSTNVTGTISSQPPCLQGCASKAALAIGCAGALDLPCYCSKEQFLINLAVCRLQTCPELADNVTLTAHNFKVLAKSCKKATGSFNLTIPEAKDVAVAYTSSIGSNFGTSATSVATASHSSQTGNTSIGSASQQSSSASMYIFALSSIGISTLLAAVALLL